MSSIPASPPFVADPESIAAMRSSRPASRGAVRAYDWLSHHRAHRPHKEAIRELGTERSFSYADLDDRADSVAGYFSSLGVGRGDRVALLAYNGVEFFDVQFACARTGAIAVLLNWRLTIAELEYILNDSSPKLLIHDAAFTEAAQELQRRCSIQTLQCIDTGSGVAAATNPYEAMVEAFQRVDALSREREKIHSLTSYAGGHLGFGFAVQAANQLPTLHAKLGRFMTASTGRRASHPATNHSIV